MSVHAAHTGALLVAGAPVEFLNAETVRATHFTGTEFRIADPGLRRLDPATAPFVEVSPSGNSAPGAWQVAGAHVDPLFGDVFLYDEPGRDALVRVSGLTLPVYPVGLVRSLSISVTNDVVELQLFGDGYKRRSVSLRDFSGELSGLSLTARDYDPQLTVRSLDDALKNGAPLLVEASKGAGLDVFRAWVKVPELSHKLTPGSLYEHTVKFTGFAFPTWNGGAVAWGYGIP